MSEPAERQYNILAFYRPGRRTPRFSNIEIPKFLPTVHRLNSIGRACVYGAAEGVYAALGFKFEGFCNNTTDTRLKQFAAHLRVAGEPSSWLTYPDGSSDSQIRQLQAGLRTVPARMLAEGIRAASGSTPYRSFTHEEIAQCVGALYVAPEDIEVGEPWVPAELNEVAELGRLRQQEADAETALRNLAKGPGSVA